MAKSKSAYVQTVIPDSVGVSSALDDVKSTISEVEIILTRLRGQQGALIALAESLDPHLLSLMHVRYFSSKTVWTDIDVSFKL